MLRILMVLLLATSLTGQSCAPSQYFNNQRCAPCQTNCVCSSQFGCDSCMSGYTFDALFQNCLPCPPATDAVNLGCTQCCSQVSGPAFICSACPVGSDIFLIGGQCIKMAGCLSLSPTNICLTCKSSYYLSQGACVQCQASCATCLDSTSCSSCQSGYYNLTDMNYAFCAACQTGCTACTSSVLCSSCGNGYRLNVNTCVACSANCLTCTAAGCSSCNSLISSLIGTVCYLCIDATKTGTVGCTSCSSNAVRILCLGCSAGYFLENNGCSLCSSRFPNSILCTAAAALQCANDFSNVLSNRYLLVGGQCVHNTKLCKDMADSSGNCGSCYFTTAGYYQLASSACTLCYTQNCLTYSSTCQCLSCLNGFQYLNNICSACQSLHCITCKSSLSGCEACATNYGLFSAACVLCNQNVCVNCDGDSNVCVICSMGYYLSQGICYTCQTNCLNCISNSQCLTCAASFYLQSNGRCKGLPTNCLQVQSSKSSVVGVCSKCAYGYMVVEGNCYPCSVALYNLKKCSSRHCPNYYLLKHGSLLTFLAVLYLLVSL